MRPKVLREWEIREGVQPHRFRGSGARLGSGLTRAAGQSQEGDAHGQAPRHKHQLDRTGGDEGNPEDQSGTLETVGRRGRVHG